MQTLDDPTINRPAAPTAIVKRDGRYATFDTSRISNAIAKALASVDGAHDQAQSDLATLLAARVVNTVAVRYDGQTPTVEQVQDIVELVLQAYGEYAAAKHYILYREKHARAREERPIPDDVRAAFAESDRYFPTALQRFQFFDKYSRFNYDLGRRETWVETVDRAVDFLHELASPYADLGADVYERIRRGILEMRVTPSMRLLAMAGEAARRQNAAIYNCCYVPVDYLDAFGETLLLSMSGCGVGYSVERQYVDALPPIARQRGFTPHRFVVEDSTEGWVAALMYGIQLWFDGLDCIFDLSMVRPHGAPLRVKGGRASGPEPLRTMLDFVRRRILSRQGSYLRPIDAHDLMCAISSAAVSGGVRRAAMISLFDFDDDEMMHCKDGDFERENSQRYNANNSAVWPDEGLTQAAFVGQFLSMVNSGRGEPGIFNRAAARCMMPLRRDNAQTWGCNPCAEVILAPNQMCNLSAIINRPGDTVHSLAEKAELAAIIGTIQSLATNFPGLRPIWREQCERERLLGVDITGQQDNREILTPTVFEMLQHVVVDTNRRYAGRLGINQSAATTVVKPSGNTSQLVDSASGLHRRWAPFYIRNVRLSASSPLANVLKDAGVPMSPENNDDPVNPRTWVVSFPVKAPEGAITRNDGTAIDQCEWWLRNKLHWTEHNPSVTITYRPDEVIDLMQWVWAHRDKIGGMAFLPSFDANYAQLPYIEIDQVEYERRYAEFPEIDFSKVYRYEQTDMTNAAQELACSAGVCSVDDIPS